jgi:hypothetical protein
MVEKVGDFPDKRRKAPPPSGGPGTDCRMEHTRECGTKLFGGAEMGLEHDLNVIRELATGIRKAGFRVFLSKSGKYGFFTDTEGKSTVSFHMQYGAVGFTANHKTDSPRQAGTGWRIDPVGMTTYQEMIAATTPTWARGGADPSTIRRTTLPEHLAMFGRSSGYTEYG